MLSQPLGTVARLGPSWQNTSTGAFGRRSGERLRELGLDAGITSQEALTHKAGVHRTYIGRLERGESGVMVEALAAILAPTDVSLRDFFRPFGEAVKPRTPRPRA